MLEMATGWCTVTAAKTVIHELYYQAKEVLGTKRVQIQFLEDYDKNLLSYKSEKKKNAEKEKFEVFLDYIDRYLKDLKTALNEAKNKFETPEGENYKVNFFNLYEDEDGIKYSFAHVQVGSLKKDRERYTISLPTVILMAENFKKKIIENKPYICGWFKSNKRLLLKERNLFSSFYPYEFLLEDLCKNVSLCYVIQYNKSFKKIGGMDVGYFEIKSIVDGKLKYTTISTPIESDGDVQKLSKTAKKLLKDWIKPHKSVLIEVYRVKGIEEADKVIKTLDNIIEKYFGEELLKDKNVYAILLNSLQSADEKDMDKFCIVSTTGKEFLDSKFIGGIVRAKDRHRIYTQVACLKTAGLDKIAENLIKITYVFSEHDDNPAIIGLKRIINPDTGEKYVKAISLVFGHTLLED